MNDYSAKTAYQNEGSSRGYLARRHYSSWVGRMRLAIEQKAVNEALNAFPGRLTFLDCPCGNGRWLPRLAEHASEIIASDISAEMLSYAEAHTALPEIVLRFLRGSAEALDLPNAAVDVVFSFALLKHLPHDVQDRALIEFARVARQGVICTFPVTGWVSRLRAKQLSRSESYPRDRQSILDIAKRAGLTCISSRRCSTPLGMEQLFWFRKAATPQAD